MQYYNINIYNIYIYICNLKNYEELLHIVMEVRSPMHDLPSASWRPSKAGGVVMFQWENQ